MKNFIIKNVSDLEEFKKGQDIFIPGNVDLFCSINKERGINKFLITGDLILNSEGEYLTIFASEVQVLGGIKGIRSGRGAEIYSINDTKASNIEGEINIKVGRDLIVSSGIKIGNCKVGRNLLFGDSLLIKRELFVGGGIKAMAYGKIECNHISVGDGGITCGSISNIGKLYSIGNIKVLDVIMFSESGESVCGGIITTGDIITSGIYGEKYGEIQCFNLFCRSDILLVKLTASNLISSFGKIKVKKSIHCSNIKSLYNIECDDINILK